MIASHFLTLFAQAWAEDGHVVAEVAEGHHEVMAIPWNSLFVQALNFAVLFAILFFALRKAVKAHMETRAREYQLLVDRAEAARRQAEQGKLEIERRLAGLQSSAEQNAEQARTEAAELRSRLLQEAQLLTKRMEQEAQRTVHVELEKAIGSLRRELLTRAIEGANQSLRQNLGSNEQKKLQNEFAEKIQVVGG